MFRVDIVSTPLIDSVWPTVSEGIEAACKKTGGDLTADYLWSECRAGRAFLVIVIEAGKIVAASVWEFQTWNNERVLCCLSLYGARMKEWLHLHKEFTEKMARTGGAVAIHAHAREGWEWFFPEAEVLRKVYRMKLT